MHYFKLSAVRISCHTSVHCLDFVPGLQLKVQKSIKPPVIKIEMNHTVLSRSHSILHTYGLIP